ncbi:MAG: T9SS type A sorting domain-containing protein, partial [Bacteroidota bacterium]
ESAGGDLPRSFMLGQNYPNPFNPSTTIQYALGDRGRVRLKVFNLLGQEVATLADGIQEAGLHSIRFSTVSLASGVYYYKLEYNGAVQTRRMLLLK